MSFFNLLPFKTNIIVVKIVAVITAIFSFIFYINRLLSKAKKEERDKLNNDLKDKELEVKNEVTESDKKIEKVINTTPTEELEDKYRKAYTRKEKKK